MDDEEEGFDTIYEIVLIEDSDWWVDEEEYKRAYRAMSDQKFVYEEDKIVSVVPGLVEFTSIDGFEITTTTDKIIYLAKSTRAVRDINRARNKKYKDTEGTVKKKDWEE